MTRERYIHSKCGVNGLESEADAELYILAELLAKMAEFLMDLMFIPSKC